MSIASKKAASIATFPADYRAEIFVLGIVSDVIGQSAAAAIHKFFALESRGWRLNAAGNYYSFRQLQLECARASGPRQVSRSRCQNE